MSPLRDTALNLLCTAAALAGAQAPESSVAPDTVPLRPDRRMPGHGAEKPEQSASEGGVLRISDVSTPMLTIVRPVGARAPTSGLVICPDGGYGRLAYD